jgi:hypothetical protein
MAGTFYTEIVVSKYTWGVIGLGGLDLIYIGSLPAIRQKSYNLFLATHLVGFAVMLSSVCPLLFSPANLI